MTSEKSEKIKSAALSYEKQMVSFLRDMIRIPSESTHESEVIKRIENEMKSVGFDEILIDGMGNILGRIGSGPTVIAYDAHIDTVGVGSRSEWAHDPFEGKQEDGVIYGRGASDQTAAMASMVYAGKIVKEQGLAPNHTLWMVGSVQEEDCDGLCWQYILREKVLSPDCVVITEPTNLGIYRGHRGRMEMAVRTFGVSCHGSAPERGKNAIYMMAKVLAGIEKLNGKLARDSFLGKGTIAASFISCETPSLCAVPSGAYIHLDRRLTVGETRESAVREVEEVIRRAGLKPEEAQVSVLEYDTPSYTGLKYPTEKYYPTWVIPEDHPVITAASSTYRQMFGEDPRVDKWTFSTNGVSTMGMFNVPTFGFGPAHEVYAHTVDDQVPISHLANAAAFYAAFPASFSEINA